MQTQIEKRLSNAEAALDAEGDNREKVDLSRFTLFQLMRLKCIKQRFNTGNATPADDAELAALLSDNPPGIGDANPQRWENEQQTALAGQIGCSRAQVYRAVEQMHLEPALIDGDYTLATETNIEAIRQWILAEPAK